MKLISAYVHDSCCRESDDGPAGGNELRLSQAELLAGQKPAVTLYFIPEDDKGEVWGDDWNDAPACCNAGAPYSGGDYANVRMVTLRYGQPIPWVEFTE